RRGQFIILLQQHGENSAKTSSTPIWRLQERLPMGSSCSNQPLPSVRSRRLRPGRIRAQVEWTGGRVVEGARLERVYRGNSIEGSNPSLSATTPLFMTKIRRSRPGNRHPAHFAGFSAKGRA